MDPADVRIVDFDLETATVESLMSDLGVTREQAESMLAYQGDLDDMIEVDAAGHEVHRDEAPSP